MKRQHFDPITLNNIAVQHLENDDFSSAFNLLKITLQIIFTIEDENPAATNTSESIDFQWSKNVGLFAKCKLNDGNCMNRYVFPRGMFTIRKTQEKRTMRAGRNLNSDVKVAIIYNAAVACHLLSLEKHCNTPLQLRAQSLYRLSQNILREARNKGFKSKLCFQKFFHVAILNNLGQLSYELVEYESSANYFSQLEKNLYFLKRKTKGNSLLWQGTGYSQKDLAGMFSNTVIKVPNTAPCA